MKKLLLFVSLSITSLAFNQNMTSLDTIKLTEVNWNRVNSLFKQPVDFNLIELEFIQLLNEYRNQLNITSLSYNSELKKATDFHVNYMIIHDTLSHKQPEIEYANYYDRVRNLTNVLRNPDTRINPGISGECLVRFNLFTAYILNKSVAEFILFAWQNSPGHNKIITCNAATKLSISINRDNKDSWVYACLLVY